MDAFVDWLRVTHLSLLFQAEVGWLWPLCESLHFLGICMLVGTAGFFDLRLLGLLRGVPLQAAWKLIPWAKAALFVNFVTGLIFLISQPEQYATNVSMWFKMLFLLVAGINALVFERLYARRLFALAPHADTPLAAKVIGGVSLVSWFAVLYFGRMIPYLIPNPQSGV
jgi:hypothetical protein